MLEHEGPLFVGVTFHARGVRSGVEPRLLQFESAMRVMAITATHEPFKHLVVVRHRKCRLDLAVATNAKLRVVQLQHSDR